MKSKNSYKKNFLSDVIFKIDFPTLLVLESESPKDFQEQIIETFPVLEPLQQLEFKIENKGIDISSQNKSRTIWRFKDVNNAISLELQSNSLAFICSKYNDYTSFRNIITEVLEKFNAIYPQTIINRLGLRYINQIKLVGKDYFSWEEYLNNNLIEHLNFIEDKNQLRRTLSTIELKCDEETNMIIKYGIFNETYPEKITKKEFVLDYDCYTTGQFEKDLIIEKIDKFYSYIINYFEKSIKDKFREVLNG